VKNKDTKILSLLEQGKENAALELVYKNYFTKIKQMVLKMSGKEEDAWDVFQDGVVVFCRKAREGKLRNDSDIGGYLYTVCRNFWFRALNKAKYKDDSEIDDNLLEHDDSTLDYVYSKENDQAISQIFSKLGNRCDELLINKYYYSYSLKEIAELMEFKNQDSVKTQLYKCKQRLLKICEKKPSLKKIFINAATYSTT